MRCITFLLFILPTVVASAQAFDPESRKLETDEIADLLTPEVKEQFGIRFEVFRVYRFDDESGEYFLVLTEKTPMNVSEEIMNDSIQAFMIRKVHGKLELKWKARDFIGDNAVSEEFSIWFWTRFFEFEDYDADGFVDPILIYGTNGLNGTSDGRIKILVYYMDKKFGVRHQNGTLDFERRTTVDKGFYDLPEEIQSRVRQIMIQITEKDFGIFPRGWKEAMDAQKTAFDEN
jgi:hypothetical protein